ncbi:GNAT family N-acetyltransferase [Micromonospora sp. WMMD1128]|uniref:GNAT family N-acetyltransferase n=1 Tax=Micromonospora sp. WMMD1128 TaxID=3015150 RepID=UPI00248BEC8F|nr:GNAT family N-acetyltransferase [Micromonospora sp. WMMD1128]WBB75659.1 GNAT family N-acetyltransferase [Micromonospora sp. WMMD1128]
MFCRMYEVAEPAVPLSRIIHWRAVTADVGMQDDDCNLGTAFVPAGHFYEMHIPVPADERRRADRERARRAGADWLLYPQIRTTGDTAALAVDGFLDLPWFIEAQYRVRAGVDDDLRAHLGNSRYRDLRRLVRRAAGEYDYRVLDGAEAAADPAALKDFDRLHALNLAKYGHRYNHLSATALDLVLDSPLRDRMRLFLRQSRADGATVQVVLCFLDPTGTELTILAQGIDPALVSPGQNVYRAAFYELYRWGEDHGVGAFSLGRGNEVKKLDVGANTYHLLANHIGGVSGADPAVFAPMRAALRGFFDRVIGELESTGGHRVTVRR